MVNIICPMERRYLYTGFVLSEGILFKSGDAGTGGRGCRYSIGFLGKPHPMLCRLWTVFCVYDS